MNDRRHHGRAAGAEEAQHHGRPLAVPQLRGAQARAEVRNGSPFAGDLLAHAHQRDERAARILSDRGKLDDLRHRAERTPASARTRPHDVVIVEGVAPVPAPLPAELVEQRDDRTRAHDHPRPHVGAIGERLPRRGHDPIGPAPRVLDRVDDRSRARARAATAGRSPRSTRKLNADELSAAIEASSDAS